MLRQQPGQLGLDRGLHLRALRRCHRQAVENQVLDMEADGHAEAPAGSSQRKSLSLTGRSSLMNSARAAASASGIVTGESAWAPRNAAFSAALWMLPPVRLSRARRS